MNKIVFCIFVKNYCKSCNPDKCNLDNWIFADRGVLMMPSDCTVDKFFTVGKHENMGKTNTGN